MQFLPDQRRQGVNEGSAMDELAKRSSDAKIVLRLA